VTSWPASIFCALAVENAVRARPNNSAGAGSIVGLTEGGDGRRRTSGRNRVCRYNNPTPFRANPESPLQ